MTHKCTCGCNPGHATAAECNRNIQATKQYMGRMTGAFHSLLARQMREKTSGKETR